MTRKPKPSQKKIDACRESFKNGVDKLQSNRPSDEDDYGGGLPLPTPSPSTPDPKIEKCKNEANGTRPPLLRT